MRRSQINRIAVVTVLALCLSLAGCSTLNKTMESWMGHDVNDLIASWGPPQTIIPDGHGGQIFLYPASKTWTTLGQATTNIYGYKSATTTTTYVPSESKGYEAWSMFWVDSKGRIYRWAWKGF